MKKVGIIIGIFVVIGIVALVFFMKQSIEKDQQKTKEKMSSVETEYDNFSQNVTAFNEKREELAEVLKDDSIYYATLSKNSSKIVKKIEECENAAKNIQTKNQKLKELCKSYYPNEEINEKCSNYEESYPKIFEVLKQDVDNYNQMVIKYNEWAKKNKNYKTIEEYELKIEDVNNE